MGRKHLQSCGSISAHDGKQIQTRQRTRIVHLHIQGYCAHLQGHLFDRHQEPSRQRPIVQSAVQRTEQAVPWQTEFGGRHSDLIRVHDRNRVGYIGKEGIEVHVIAQPTNLNRRPTPGGVVGTAHLHVWEVLGHLGVVRQHWQIPRQFQGGNAEQAGHLQQRRQTQQVQFHFVWRSHAVAVLDYASTLLRQGLRHYGRLQGLRCVTNNTPRMPSHRQSRSGQVRIQQKVSQILWQVQGDHSDKRYAFRE